ncbi:hypothetical protein SVAN01_03398 [Stagonosporopsis vannaccii]|nr:hypothetical protein SVAN01_03398 [Stagonosporopsis vannaccii]
MGKKKVKGEYNDFLEDTRYQNNNDVRTTLQSTSTLTRTVSPPGPNPPSQHRNTTNLNSKPKKPPLTHFLCLPLITPENRPQLAAALAKLRTDVQSHTPVPAKAVRPVGTLHLTLGVMSLSPTQLSDAITHLGELDIAQLLRGITTQTIADSTLDSPSVSENAGAVANPALSPAVGADPEVLPVRLMGLVPMQKRQQTSILYAEPVEGTGRLGRFAESVRRGFEERGLLVEDQRALRLHATVVNTVYAKPKGRGAWRGKAGVVRDGAVGEEGGGGDGQQQGSDGEVDGEERGKAHAAGAKSWMRFDASTLIDAYKDFVWADDVRIDRVQICKMGAKKKLDEDSGEVVDEEYEVIAEKCI